MLQSNRHKVWKIIRAATEPSAEISQSWRRPLLGPCGYNQFLKLPVPPSHMVIALASLFHNFFHHKAQCLNSVLNVKALVLGAFNSDALVAALKIMWDEISLTLCRLDCSRLCLATFQPGVSHYPPERNKAKFWFLIVITSQTMRNILRKVLSTHPHT